MKVDDFIDAVMKDEADVKGLQIAISNLVERTISGLSSTGVSYEVEELVARKVVERLEPIIEQIVEAQKAELFKVIGGHVE